MEGWEGSDDNEEGVEAARRGSELSLSHYALSLAPPAHSTYCPSASTS